MNNKNSRTNALPGLLKKKSPLEIDWKSTAKLAVKAAKPLVGKIAKTVLGPLGLVLGAKSATAGTVYDEKTGKNKYTGKKTYAGGQIDFSKSK